MIIKTIIKKIQTVSIAILDLLRYIRSDIHMVEAIHELPLQSQTSLYCIYLGNTISSQNRQVVTEQSRSVEVSK